MASVAAATPTPAAFRTAAGKFGPTMDTGTGGRVPEDWPPLAVKETGTEDGADRQYTGERPRSDSSRLRRSPRHRRLGKSFGFANVAIVSALAVGFVIAVSALHRMIWCLEGALRQKGSVKKSTGISSRRLAPGEGDTHLPHLPSYEEAIGSSPFAPSGGPADATWDPASGELGAPPPYSERGEPAPPPPPYEEVCGMGVWTVSGPRAPRQSEVVRHRSILFAYKYELIVGAVWLLSAVVGILVGNFTSLGSTVSSFIGAGLATVGTAIVVAIVAMKLHRLHAWRRRPAAGPVDA